MKKICFITTIPSTIKSFILSLAKYIHQNTDWDISIICDYDEELKKELPEYIHYYPIKMKRGVNLAGIKAIYQMIKIFKKEKFDLIQYSTPNASFYASISGRISKIPSRLYCQWGMVYISFEGLKRKVFKIMEKLICRLSTNIEPDSNSNLIFAHDEKLYPNEKGRVIWNGSACGVDIKKFDIKSKEKYRTEIRKKYLISDNDIVYGFVGRITRDKGINELFSAYKKILKEKQNVYLLMVGNPEIDSTIDKELYNWIKQQEKVVFVGFTREVEKYLSAMDVYILPSYREGFGMGVIEAEAMGVPVIVTNIPGPIDAMVENKTGLTVEKKNANSLYNAMIKVYNNNKILDEFSNNASEFAIRNFEQNRLFEYIIEDRKKIMKIK